MRSKWYAKIDSRTYGRRSDRGGTTNQEQIVLIGFLLGVWAMGAIVMTAYGYLGIAMAGGGSRWRPIVYGLAWPFILLHLIWFIWKTPV